MELALNEVKTQAKKLLKASRIDGDLDEKVKISLKKLALSSTSLAELKLKHCLTYVSQQLGFDNWHHAQDVLSGSKKPTSALDMGSFFYPKGAGGFINEWFVDYQQAKNTLNAQQHSKWLLPYKKQFIVVEKNYIDVFQISSKSTFLWAELSNDMVAGYNSVAWDQLTFEIIKNRPKGYTC